MSTYDATTAVAYDDTYRGRRFRTEDRVLAGRLRRAFQMHRPVIDIGCGTGALIDLIDPPLDRYLGYDISKPMISAARAKHPMYGFCTADATLIPSDLVNRKPADVYLGWGVINEVSDPAAVLSLAASITMGVGTAVVLAATARGVQHSPIYQEHGSQWCARSFTAQSLRDAAGAAGLIGTIHGITRWHHRAPWWASAAVEFAERPINRIDPDSCMYLMLTATAR